MDFNLSDEQDQLRKLAREFTTREILPVAAHHDETLEFPRAICEKAHELGLMNTHVPEEYGGPGLGTFERCLIAEEIGAGCAAIWATMETNELASAPVLVAGTHEQKKRFIEPLTRELLFPAYCVTEPAAGSDVSALQTTARRVGTDWVINGAKMWITNGTVASWYFVLACTDRAAGSRGMSGFIVDATTPGIQVGHKEKKMGQRCSDTVGVTFEDVKVPASNLLGREGEAFKTAMAAFDITRPSVAAAAVGLARAAMEHSIRYAEQRQTFGVPLHQHQAISFMIADMAKDVEAARLLTWQAAWLIDQGRRNTKHAAFAKAFAADTAMRVASDAVQVFGGYGYSREYPVEKLMRDAKVFQIYEGTSQIQRLVIAKELFSR
jgi:acyl-CoA dehydrogenase